MNGAKPYAWELLLLKGSVNANSKDMPPANLSIKKYPILGDIYMKEYLSEIPLEVFSLV
jgi:hypothetical protein